ncbi:MAG: ectonucleotide pyrophosphatase/phosphodiesterase [Vicinamibacteraceae bacterium]
MRVFVRCLLAAALAVAALLPLGAAPDAPRVLLISIDGLKPASYTDPALAARTPNLRRLAQEGIWADGVVGVTPTVTYPSHTTLITGVQPARHGIYDNRILDPENRSNGAWYWYARAIQVQTLPGAVRARGLTAAGVTWPVSVGMDLDFNAPEFPGTSRHPEGVQLLRALSTPRSLFDGAELARGSAFGWPQNDRDRTDLTSFILRTYAPNLTMLHLIGLDAAQHTYGPGSPEALEAMALMDRYVGELVDAARKTPGGDRTTIAVVSDHGFLPLTTQLQPNAALKAAGLIDVDAAGAVTGWRAWSHSAGGSAYIYVKDAADRPKVAALLETLRKDPANGIRAVWTAEDLAKAGGHPDAQFGIDMADGFYTSNAHDTLRKPSTSKGGHGFAPDRRELHASLVLAGPAVTRRGTVGIVTLTQVGPTLATIFGVSLDPQAAAPILLTAR